MIGIKRSVKMQEPYLSHLIPYGTLRRIEIESQRVEKYTEGQGGRREEMERACPDS